MDDLNVSIEEQISNTELLINAWKLNLDLDRQRYETFKFLEDEQMVQVHRESIEKAMKAIKFLRQKKANLVEALKRQGTSKTDLPENGKVKEPVHE